jgi:hypothetical protein
MKSTEFAVTERPRLAAIIGLPTAAIDVRLWRSNITCCAGCVANSKPARRRQVDAARKRVPISASGGQHF